MGFYAAKKDIYSFGTLNNDSSTQALGASATTTVETISNTGMFYHLLVSTVAKADVDDLQPQIELDGNPLLPIYMTNPFSFAMYNDKFVLDAKPSAPIRVIEFNTDGICTLDIFFPNGLPFNTSCVFTVRNPDTDGHSIWYTLLTTVFN